MAPNLTIARQLLQGAEKSCRQAETLIVNSAQLREALGEQHPLSRHLRELQIEYQRREAEHYKPYIEQGEPDPPKPRNIEVTCADVGGKQDCPLVGPIVVRSREWVELPRLPYLKALREAVNPPAKPAAAEKPPAKTS